MADLKGDESK